MHVRLCDFHEGMASREGRAQLKITITTRKASPSTHNRC